MAVRAQSSVASRLRRLPAVDELLKHERLRALDEEAGRPLVLAAAREVLTRVRQQIRSGLREKELDELLVHLDREVAAEVREWLGASLRPVINATGVVLHTNLGRAPLGAEAARRVFELATRYTNLEFDLGSGKRGRRDTHAAKFLNRLLGAEASVVVNNNAAAVLLVLSALAEGGEVVVSRGELIEIGGSFRIPDIMTRSGAVLREVGTTNRTRLADYTRGVNRRTRLLLRVHPSNFRIVGFTERPSLEELAALARKRRLPLVEDLGSGLLAELSAEGLGDEPLAGASLRAGVDVITFSGDKLLGGPQAGVIAGKKKFVDQCRKHPLFRALRVDKMTYAALEATLRSYLRGETQQVPALCFLRVNAEEIGRRAERLRARLAEEVGEGATLSVKPGRSVVGGGSAPGYSLPTALLTISPRRLSSAELAARLRRADAPVVARVEADCVLLDLRTVFPDQEEKLAAALREALTR